MQNCGKKTERLWLPRQLSMDPFLAARLRDLAERDCRKLEDEIRFLVMAALNSRDAQAGNEQKRIFARSPEPEGTEMPRGRQSRTLRPDQVARLEKFRRLPHEGAPHGYSIPQLRTAIGAQFKWGTLKRALEGLPIWELHYDFIAAWIERLPNGQPSQEGHETDELDQEKAGAARTLRGPR